ncbi:MAG: KGK domain-containing protein [Planktothrix sp.]
MRLNPMTDNFYPLTCDDDLLLIDKDTFTVARFKEFAMDSLSQYTNRIIERQFQNSTRIIKEIIMFDILNPYSYGIDKKIGLGLTQSCWSNVSESVECKLFRLTSGKGWISGKLIIKSTVNLFPEDYKNFTYDPKSPSYPKSEIDMELQFCPDEPEPLETSDSTLDELRKQLQIHK